MSGLSKDTERNYLGILSDGTLRQKVTQETPGAVRREYETSDKKKGVKWELVFNQIEGHIVKIELVDGDYGKMLQLHFAWDGGTAIVSVNTSSNFGEDVMKKLPNVRFNLPVRFRPFAFEADGKLKKGVSLTQQRHGEVWEKIPSFFWDAGEKVLKNGYPAPEGKPEDYSKDDWKVYFIQARKFLMGYIVEHVVPLVEAAEHTGASAGPGTEVTTGEEEPPYPTEDINPDDIPF